MLGSPPREARRAFERDLQRLLGRTIQAVAYFELPYEDGQPMWNQESSSFDSLDFGLQLTLDDGSIFSLTWGSVFTQYNVSIRWAPLGGVDELTRQWDVQQRWRERRLLDTPIITAQAVWVPTHRRARAKYPQDVRLRFESGAVVIISAFECQDGEFTGMTDNVTVFFEEAHANRMLHGT